MKAKKISRREIGKHRIQFAGYHNQPYQLIAIEYRISYEVARQEHYKGYQKRLSGMKCNCLDCNPK